MSLAEKHFGKLAAGTPKAAVGYTPFTGSEVKVRDDLKKTAHFAIAVEAPAADHADYYPMLVAAAHVGSFDAAWYGRNTTGSPLAQFAADHHAAKGFQSFYTAFQGTGLWGARATTEGEAIEDFVFALQNRWSTLATV